MDVIWSSCIFVGLLTPNPRLENLGLQFQLRAQNQTPTPTLRLIVRHNDCVMKDDLREIFNSSNQRCTLVYRVLVVK